MTGAHRSGTTVLGDLVCRAPGTWGVWEPFNRNWGLRGIRDPYPSLAVEPPDPELTRLMHYLTTGRGRWTVKRGPGGARLPWLNERLRAAKRWRSWHAHHGDVAVIKDPFLLLSLRGVQRHVTGERPSVVAVRHPCAWIASLRRMNWPARNELSSLLTRLDLRELAETNVSDHWDPRDDLDAAAVVWTILYGSVRRQADEGAVVMLVPLERFGVSPVSTMSGLYDVLGLPQPGDLRQLAEDYTGSDHVVIPAAGTVHELHRDSRALNTAWRNSVTPAEERRVRTLTEHVYASIYSSWDGPEEQVAELLG